MTHLNHKNGFLFSKSIRCFKKTGFYYSFSMDSPLKKIRTYMSWFHTLHIECKEWHHRPQRERATPPKPTREQLSFCALLHPRPSHDLICVHLKRKRLLATGEKTNTTHVTWQHFYQCNIHQILHDKMCPVRCNKWTHLSYLNILSHSPQWPHKVKGSVKYVLAIYICAVVRYGSSQWANSFIASLVYKELYSIKQTQTRTPAH